MGKDLWNAVYSQRELIFRMLASCILGGAIGFERKHRHKGAGMRTHALVCLGSALMMIVSKYGFTDFPDIDGSRIAAPQGNAMPAARPCSAVYHLLPVL